MPSSILAAVAGGLVHAIERDRVESSMLRLNIVSNNTWSVLLYVLNGLVFILLGLQIPHVTKVVLRNESLDNVQVFLYAIAIYVILVVLRFAWTFVFTRNQKLFGSSDNQQELPSFRMLLLASLGGVRGAVTLAGAFSIPYVLQNGSPFPERDLMIFLAAIVILLSLAVASVLLPLLARKKAAPGTSGEQALKRHVRIQVLEAAIQALKTEQNQENGHAASSVIADYQKWVHEESFFNLAHHSGSKRSRAKETEIRLAGIAAERRCIESMREEGSVDAEQAASVAEFLDQAELVLTKPAHLWRILFKLFYRKLNKAKRKQSKFTEADITALKGLKVTMCEAAIAALEQSDLPDAEQEIRYVTAHYKQILNHLARAQTSQGNEDSLQNDLKKELYWVAIQGERDKVQSLYESGEISREFANDLRNTIRDRETTISEMLA